jgi:hypothetical protein
MTRYEQWQANPSSGQPQAPVSSTPSSLLTCAFIPLRNHTPSPYEQSPTEDDRARCERLDALLREDPRQREDVYPADGAREDRRRLRRRCEEEVRRWVAGQRRLEPRLGQPTGQNQGVTGPVMPVSSPVQYPSFSASAWDPFGPITAYLQVERTTRCVIFRGL